MNYEFSIPISKHLYEDVPLYVITIAGQKILNKVRKYAPIETGHLQDSIQIKTEDLDHSKMTIYVNIEYFMDWDDDVPYYRYTNENANSHYRRGAFKGQSTRGWWDRLCKAFFDLWKEKADKLENYQRKESDTNASAKEHRVLIETDNIRKLRTTEVTKDQMENEVENVEERVEDYKNTHKSLRTLTYQRLGYIEPNPQQITKMSVKDMQTLSVENMEYLLNKELGLKLPIKFARSKTEYRKMKKELLEVSKDYGEILIGGIPVRTLIRELIRKLLNSEHIDAF